MVWIGNKFGNVNDTPALLVNDDIATTESIFAEAHVYGPSDARLKNNIRNIENPIEVIKQFNGVEFEWKKDGKTDVGLISQDVEKVYPFLIKEHWSTKDKWLNYDGIIAPIVEAIKEQQLIIEEQSEMIQALQEEVEGLKNQEQKNSFFGF